MKKILLVLSVMLLTGCGNKLVCNLETSEENYESKQKITFKFDSSDKVNDVTVDYTMIFEDEETAKTYKNVFETLDDNYEINLEKNEINIISTKNYDQYKENKEELKKQFENNGYSCK